MAIQPQIPPPAAVPDPGVRVLAPDDVPRLRLEGGRRLGGDAARRMVEAYPGRSVWIPDTLEFALLAPWRHRDEIALVQEMDAAGNAEVLLAAAVDRCRALGTAMVLVIELDEVRRPRLYTRAGLQPIEDVIAYELDRPQAGALGRNRLAFARVTPDDAAGMDELRRIDHAAFPWLWWNSDAEFAAYAGTAGVRLYLARRSGRAVAYVGITTYLGWGHLDRIAVDPAEQGRGYGRQALAFAVDTLARAGARRVGLSTQRANVRSQRLYESAGFRRSPSYDYRLYGAVLRPPAPGLATGERPEEAPGDGAASATTEVGPQR